MKFNRVLLKLSGEAFADTSISFGIDAAVSALQKDGKAAVRSYNPNDATCIAVSVTQSTMNCESLARLLCLKPN